MPDQDRISLANFAQVRQQLTALCEEQRFSAAYMFLLGSGMPATGYPGLWEYLSRSSASAGDTVIAHDARQALWQAGQRSEDIAIKEARYFLGQGDWKVASFLLKTVLGDPPASRTAHFILVECYLQRARAETQDIRLRTNRDLAVHMDAQHDPETAGEAALLIDLLRFSGALERAQSRNEAARQSYPNDSRFDLRSAQILEQLRNPAAAIIKWEEISGRFPQHRTEALFKLYQLNTQLDRSEAMARAAARLLLDDLPIDQLMRLAIATHQREMITALARLAATQGVGQNALRYDTGVALTDMLLENGDIGLVVWLRRQRLPLSDRSKRILDAAGFGVGGHRALPDTLAEATKLCSPDFMLPLHTHLKRPEKPAGWPGDRKSVGRLLLLNGTLGGGGAERQFVALVSALIGYGMRPEDIHCAFFSLEADRGFDRFLPDLQALGVPIHDLRQRRIANPSIPADEGAAIDTLPTEMKEDARALWHLAKDVAPDTLHGWQDRAGLAAAIVGELAGTERIIFSTRNLAADTRGDLRLVKMRPLYRDFLSRSNCTLTANAKVGAEDYARWLGQDARKIHLLRNAVDPARFSPARVRKGPRWKKGQPIVIGGVFRLAANKRPFLWLETIAILRESHGLDLVPLLFGNGPLLEEIEATAEKLRLSDLHIVTDTTDPGEIYGKLDAMLLMSRIEGVPNVLIEAQACGIATAACDAGGVAEALLQRGPAAGLLLDRDPSPAEAASALAKWLPDAVSQPAGRRAAFVQRRFSPQSIAADAMSLYLRGET